MLKLLNRNAALTDLCLVVTGNTLLLFAAAPNAPNRIVAPSANYFRSTLLAEVEASKAAIQAWCGRGPRAGGGGGGGGCDATSGKGCGRTFNALTGTPLSGLPPQGTLARHGSIHDLRSHTAYEYS